MFYSYEDHKGKIYRYIQYILPFSFLVLWRTFCKFIISAYIIGFTIKNTIHVNIVDIINGFRVFKEYFHFVLF